MLKRNDMEWRKSGVDGGRYHDVWRIFPSLIGYECVLGYRYRCRVYLCFWFLVLVFGFLDSLFVVGWVRSLSLLRGTKCLGI